MFFGLSGTQSKPQDFDRFLVLFVGSDPKLRKDVEEAIRWIRTREANEEKLLQNIKQRLPELQSLLEEVEADKGIKYALYWFYFDRWNRPVEGAFARPAFNTENRRGANRAFTGGPAQQIVHRHCRRTESDTRFQVSGRQALATKRPRGSGGAASRPLFPEDRVRVRKRD